MKKLAFIILLLAFAAGFQYFFDLRKKERPLAPLTVIPAQAIKLGSLGLDSAAASFMWIYTIQQFTDYPYDLPRLIKTVNALDPKFSYPYAFAAFILPAFKATDQAVEIAKEGIDKADPDWQIPYYLAATYHSHLKDRKNAALYFDLAANTPGAFEGARVVASRYGTRTNVRDQTKEIWESIYETSRDELVKESAKNHLVHIGLVEALEKAVSLYRQKYGTYPKDINNLVAKKIIKQIPASPFEVEFGLGEKGAVLTREKPLAQ